MTKIIVQSVQRSILLKVSGAMTKDRPLYFYRMAEKRVAIWVFWDWCDSWTGYYWDKKNHIFYKNIVPFFPWLMLAIKFYPKNKEE